MSATGTAIGKVIRFMIHSVVDLGMGPRFDSAGSIADLFETLSVLDSNLRLVALCPCWAVSPFILS